MRSAEQNGLDLGNDHLNRKAGTEFVKCIAGALHANLKSKLIEAKFDTSMSESSTDCILMICVDHHTKEPVTNFASIEPLETPDANGVFATIKRDLQIIYIDLETLNSESDNGPVMLVMC